MKHTTVLAPVIDLKRGSNGDDRQISDTPPHIAAGLKVCVRVCFVYLFVFVCMHVNTCSSVPIL